MNENAIFVFAVAIIAFASISAVARQGRFTAPMMFTGLGLLAGPLLLDVVELDVENSTVDLLAELALVTALFSDAVRIDVRKLRRYHSLPLRLLGVGLPLTMLLGTLTAMLLFPAFGIWEAAVLAVILGPTDAALGEPVVTAKEVHGVVRQGLNVESGLNDGLGLPALLVVASFASLGAGGDRDAGDWALYVPLQITGGPLVGLVLGYGARALLQVGLGQGRVSADFGNLALFMLPLGAYAGAEIVGANGFLAAFATGVIVSTSSGAVRDAVEEFTGTVGQLLNSLVFFLLGATLLPGFLHHIGGAHVLFALLALTVLRMVPVALALIGTRLHVGSMLFMGWFGPRGTASIIYLLIVMSDFSLPHIDDIAATVALTVLASIVAHGLTAAPGARRYGRYVASLASDSVEDEVVPGQRLPGQVDTAQARALDKSGTA